MTKDVDKTPLDGIWGISELSTPKKGGRRGESVRTVVAVEAKRDKSKTVWEHPKHDLEECEMKKRSLVKRRGVQRYAPEQLQECFAAVPF
jgi:hypothetical protein